MAELCKLYIKQPGIVIYELSVCLSVCVLAAVDTTIRFTYVEKYPDEPPLWEIHSQENLEDSDVEDILALLQQQVSPSDLNIVSFI